MCNSIKRPRIGTSGVASGTYRPSDLPAGLVIFGPNPTIPRMGHVAAFHLVHCADTRGHETRTGARSCQPGMAHERPCIVEPHERGSDGLRARTCRPREPSHTRGGLLYLPQAHRGTEVHAARELPTVRQAREAMKGRETAVGETQEVPPYGMGVPRETGCPSIPCRCRLDSMPKPTNRPSAARRGYSERWRKARATYLRSHPLCVPCERAGRTTVASCVHHKIPHRGDPVKFWDQANWEVRCRTCHTDAIGPEATGRRETYRGASTDGTPLDPGHHWHHVGA